MKNVFIKLIVFILLIISVVSFVACGNDDTNDTDGEAAVTGINVFDDGCYILADWENYEQMSQIFLSGYFGKVSASSEYATRNSYSGKLEIHGYAYAWGWPWPSFVVNTNDKFFQKRDFSDCDAFLFDIYSPMQYDILLNFYITNTSAEKSSMIKLTIKPEWNYFSINKGDLGAKWLDEVTEFKFEFNRGDAYPDQQVIYIDNFRAHKIEE